MAGCLGDTNDNGNGNGNGGMDDEQLTVGINSEPTTLDAHESTRIPERLTLSAIHEPLFYLNPDAEPVSHLVSDYEINEDATEFVFQLEENVTFHNGESLDAEIVEWNFDRIFDIGINAGDLEPITSFDVTGEHELTIETEAPFPLLLQELAEFSNFHGMVSREAVEEAGDDFGREVIVGTGPYEFVEWEAADRIRLERYDDYDWGPDFATQQQSSVEEIEIRIIPEASTLTNELMVGDVDAAYELSLGQSDEVESNDGTDVERNQGTWTFLPINVDREPTDEVEVRRAISHAIDREPLLQVGLNGEGELLYGYVPPFWGGGLSESENQELAYQYDPDRARELLEEAGWTNDEEGEVRSRDGEDLELDLLSFPLGLLENMAEAIQSMLADVGIATDYRAPEASTFYTDLENDEHHIATSGGSFTPFASSVLSRYYHGSERVSEGGRNYSNYDNPEVNDLIGDLQTDPDPDARDEAAMEAQRTLHEDAVAVNLNLLNRNYGYDTRLTGIDTWTENPLWWGQYHLHWREVEF
ncbi:ABC transporter substrate-binding protein [Natrarchaeobius sp. A-rgal3]|uniref:ABC transporter substrate-binding protein n=1 Tax=Natrarchaeobius versutus TaxID=1679078 RepID=UPI00351051AD